MARIFITGSADGLGQLAAKALIEKGHKVVLHARDEKRLSEALAKLPGAEAGLAGDLSSITEIKVLAAKANTTGTFDTVIHNAGVYRVSGETTDGLPIVFAVNTIAPYLLTALMNRPKRLIYLSSGMHLHGDLSLDHLSRIGYSDTKLHNVILAMAVARLWPEVYSNAIDPGWVPTKMGGSGAPDDLGKGFETQVWLAGSNDEEALISGKYFHHKKQARYRTEASDPDIQEKLVSICARLTGVSLQ